MRNNIKLRLKYNWLILDWYLSTLVSGVVFMGTLALWFVGELCYVPIEIRFWGTVILCAPQLVLLLCLMAARNVEYSAIANALEVLELNPYAMYYDVVYRDVMYATSKLEVHAVLRRVLTERHPTIVWLEYKTEVGPWEHIKTSLWPTVF